MPAGTGKAQRRQRGTTIAKRAAHSPQTRPAPQPWHTAQTLGQRDGAIDDERERHAAGSRAISIASIYLPGWATTIARAGAASMLRRSTGRCAEWPARSSRRGCTAKWLAA
jgi:hypothetical protein